MTKQWQQWQNLADALLTCKMKGQVPANDKTWGIHHNNPGYCDTHWNCSTGSLHETWRGRGHASLFEWGIIVNRFVRPINPVGKYLFRDDLAKTRKGVAESSRIDRGVAIATFATTTGAADMVERQGFGGRVEKPYYAGHSHRYSPGQEKKKQRSVQQLNSFKKSRRQERLITVSSKVGTGRDTWDSISASGSYRNALLNGKLSGRKSEFVCSLLD